VPTIEMTPRTRGWSSEPVNDNLAEVSNNGFGYTGEIDLYELVTPAAGRLQISLNWDHAANYDVIVAAADRGETRLVEGLRDAGEPEYVSVDVVEGQQIFIFVAGWAGEPGPYVLETLLLPPGTPVFALLSGPDLSAPWPANRPLTFTFNATLDPTLDVADRAYIAGAGRLGEGTWCAHGPDLTFYPRLPATPGDPGGLVPGESYTIQFQRAAHGVRAYTGEYLSEVVTAHVTVAAPIDFSPGSPPYVAGLTPAPGAPHAGEAITVALSEALDPATVVAELAAVLPDGTEVPYPADVALTQEYRCSGALEVRLLTTPAHPPPAGAATRLRLGGGTLGISGDPGPDNAIGGGAGFTVDFRAP